ncbi:MAG TPA: tetratricopeptide repeat protein [Polyangiaceae bacterium]|jgi:hypothetical protein
MGRENAVRAVVFACVIGLGLEGVALGQDAPGADRSRPRRGEHHAGARGGGHAGPVLREHLDSDPLADAARAKMRSGDCAGALDAFDQALQTSTDPTLLRDRGLCHEQLAQPYPAIDDLRGYLTAAPEAADAEAMRGHLARLEQATLGYSSESTDVPGDVEGGASATAKAEEAPRKQAEAQEGGDPPALGPSEPMEDISPNETPKDDDPRASALRSGTGWSLAPMFSMHKWGASPASLALAPGAPGASFGSRGTWAECVGAAARYSTSARGAVLVEVGYEHFNATTDDLAVVSGLSSQIAFEWRFPFDARYDDEVVLAPGLGFEHLAISPSSPQAQGTSSGAFVPRLRVGWRHMVASAAALELSLDGGVANFFSYSQFPFSSESGSTSYFAGLNVALLWGL